LLCHAIGFADKFLLSEISPQDARWDRFRVQADSFKDLYRGTIYDSYADRIAGCSGRLGFSSFQNPETGEVKLKLQSARFCRVPRCPVCQWRRQQMWRAKAFKVMPKILKNYPTARWLFLTLTVRNCPVVELRSTLAHMNQSWARLTQLKLFPATGWLKSVEVTRVWDCYDAGKFVGRHGSTWVDKWETLNKCKLRLVSTEDSHPHFHVLLMVPPGYFGRNYLNHEKWTQMWAKSLRVDYVPVVDIRAVNSLTGANAGMFEAVMETIKYSVKPSDVLSSSTNGDIEADKKWLVDLTSQLYKTKSIATGGLLKQYLKELEDEPEDLIHSDELNMDEFSSKATSLMFQWFEGSKLYRHIDD
jgi:plasmid rolling circle replication initiator protein Rep